MKGVSKDFKTAKQEALTKTKLANLPIKTGSNLREIKIRFVAGRMVVVCYNQTLEKHKSLLMIVTDERIR